MKDNIDLVIEEWSHVWGQKLPLGTKQDLKLRIKELLRSVER